MRYTLIDEIITKKWSIGHDGIVPDVNLLAAAQVIRIDNVDEYFWMHFGEVKDLSKLPNIAPPFDNYFMYVDSSAITTSDGKQRRNEYPKYQWGIWFLSWPIEKSDTPELIEWFSSEGTNRLILKKQGVKWCVQAMVFEKYKTKMPPLYRATTRYLVMEDGSYSNFPDSWNMSQKKAEQNASFYGVSEEEIFDAVIELCRVMVGTCYLATSFMHCKNVKLDDAEMTPREKMQSRDYEKRHGEPAAKWKVLNIEPMKRVLSAVGGIEKNGPEKALHICRGHFKDYRNTSGLFGKHKDIYWWEQHMRGNEQNGIVIKDYNIIQ